MRSYKTMALSADAGPVVIGGKDEQVEQGPLHEGLPDTGSFLPLAFPPAYHLRRGASHSRGFSVSADRLVHESLRRLSTSLPTTKARRLNPSSDLPPVNLVPWRGVIPAGHRRWKRRSDGKIRGGMPSTRKCLSAHGWSLGHGERGGAVTR